MRIAIDVKGTLEGPKQDVIRAFAKRMHDEGHEVVVWSNMFSFATDFVNAHKLPYKCDSKAYRGDVEKEYWYDLAIEDDRSQDYLPAHKIVFVGDFDSVDQLVKEAA